MSTRRTYQPSPAEDAWAWCPRRGGSARRRGAAPRADRRACRTRRRPGGVRSTPRDRAVRARPGRKGSRGAWESRAPSLWGGDRSTPGDRGAVHEATVTGEVGHREVLEATVVPHRHIADLPPPAAGEHVLVSRRATLRKRSSVPISQLTSTGAAGMPPPGTSGSGARRVQSTMAFGSGSPRRCRA